MSNKHYYFAYGMNTDPEAMSLRTGTPTAIGRGLVRDHAFRFATHGDVYSKINSNTFGVLWEIDDAQLASLDIREGYPHYYDRKIVTVEAGGTTYEAWMYFMTPGHLDEPPHQSYYDMLTRGYTAFGVPLTQIIDALELANIASELREKHKNTGKQIRWFDSYTHLIKELCGKKRLSEIDREAASQCISTEQLCQDYVDYDVIYVPAHFQVRDSIYQKC